MSKKKVTNEQKSKISLALTGTHQSPEHLAKLVAARTGKKRTPAQLERIRAGQRKRREWERTHGIDAVGMPLGFKHTAESKRRMSESQRRNADLNRLQKAQEDFLNNTDDDPRPPKVASLMTRLKQKLTTTENE